MEIEPYLYRGTDPEPECAEQLGWLAEAHPARSPRPTRSPGFWREVLLWLPDRPEQQLQPDDPLRRLRRIAFDSAHLLRRLPPGTA